MKKIFLGDAELSKANLTEANLEEANLNSADLNKANLRGANFKNAKMGADTKNQSMGIMALKAKKAFFDLSN